MLLIQVSDMHLFTDHADIRAQKYLDISRPVGDGIGRGFINGVRRHALLTTDPICSRTAFSGTA